jgi:class 3 adenylate cyclase
MGLSKDLRTEVTSFLKTRWDTRDGRVVPDAEDVQLGNDAVKLTGTVLYADLADSTELVKLESPAFAAAVYKSYLHCASKIIKKYSGVVTAFDGDRVMAVFIGDRKNTNAVRTALAINHAVKKVINPQIEAIFPSKSYQVSQAVGIDTSPLFIARTGVRGANDLVWVGRSANYAAKLCSLRVGSYATFITASVYDNMRREVKVGGEPERSMWEWITWDEQDITVYRSSWHWSPG